MEGAAYLRAPEAVTGEVLAGAAVVAVVDNAGRVVVGVALIGATAGVVVEVEPAGAAAGVKASRPTMATTPTRAAGASHPGTEDVR